MTELANADLPAPRAHRSALPLDTLEATVAALGQRLMARLCALQWAEIDAQATAAYCAAQAPDQEPADGYETLTVASRFGTLRRQVCTHQDGRPHVMPGNALLPPHQGLLITRGLQELACLLPQDLPFATAARLLGWQAGEPGLLSATTLHTLVRAHGDRIRRLEHAEAPVLLNQRQGGRQLQTVPLERSRRRPGWPAALSAAVEATLAQEQWAPPDGVSASDLSTAILIRDIYKE